MGFLLLHLVVCGGFVSIFERTAYAQTSWVVCTVTNPSDGKKYVYFSGQNISLAGNCTNSGNTKPNTVVMTLSSSSSPPGTVISDWSTP